MNTTLIAPATLTADGHAFGTSAAPDASLASSQQDARERGWSEVIDGLLGLWVPPDALVFGELEPLRQECLQGAIEFATEWKRAGVSPPTAWSPTAVGGVSFEWRSGGVLEEAEVVTRGTLEITVLNRAAVEEHFFIRRNPQTRALERFVPPGVPHEPR